MGNVLNVNIKLCDIPQCFHCFVQRSKYKTTVKIDLDELQDKMEMLQAQKIDVDTAKKSGEKVNVWRKKVDKVKIEVEKQKSSATQELDGTFCHGGFFSNRGEKVKGLLNKVNYLIERGNFEEGASKTGQAKKRPCERILIGLESTFKSVWECIDQEDIGIVGLYGKGGVGKTALLIKINNMFCETESRPVFVIYVQGSRKLKLEDLQKKILEEIGVREESRRHQDKAMEIFTFLNEREFVLLLDDIWEGVDLKKLGVPYPDRDNKSKVIFTTRLRGVCDEMKVDESFEVECLAARKARELFEKVVGANTLNSHHEIPEHVEFMANWCGGLPLAVITIARRMACMKTPQEWARERAYLNRNPSRFPCMKEEVFSVLKESFDHLSSDEVKSCFLYCSLFPKGHRISEIGLIDHWIGAGLLDKIGTAKLVDDGYSKIGTLFRAGLLEKVENGDVKMHNVIHEKALWISTEDERNGKFFVYARRSDPLTRMPDDAEEVRGVKRMSVMENKIETLPESPTYSTDLETLFLNSNLFKRVSGGFFQRMLSLKVLNLSNNPLTELPLEIANLVLLRHLDLSSTQIEELPKELESLIELRCLNLEDTSALHKIPRKLISSFKKLLVLRMLGCGSLSPTAAIDNVLSNDAGLFEELQGLECLEILTITLKTSQAFHIFFSSEIDKLRTCTQSLGLQSLPAGVRSIKLDSPKDFKSLKNLYILNCTDLEDFNIDCRPGVDPYFARLDTVIISSCPKLNDLTELIILAPELKRIKISNCPHTKEIINVVRWHDFPDNVKDKVPFEKLESLKCQEMESLQSIYWNALPLPQLKKIRVVGCPELKKLPLDSNSAQGGRIIIEGERQWCESLEWEDDAARDAFSTCFKYR